MGNPNKKNSGRMPKSASELVAMAEAAGAQVQEKGGCTKLRLGGKTFTVSGRKVDSGLWRRIKNCISNDNSDGDQGA